MQYGSFLKYLRSINFFRDLRNQAFLKLSSSENIFIIYLKLRCNSSFKNNYPQEALTVKNGDKIVTSVV